MLRDGTGAGWAADWSAVAVAAGAGPGAARAPLVPAGGCPAAGLESRAGVPFWLPWWSYAHPSSTPAMLHMAAACGAIAGIPEAGPVLAYLAREDRLGPAAWAACPRYAIRPPPGARRDEPK